MRKFSLTTRENLRRTSRRRVLVRIVIVALVLLLLWQLVPRTVGYVASFVMTPILAVEHWVNESSGMLPTYIRDRRVLQAKNDELEQKLAEQRSARASIAYLQAENASLRTLLGASTSPRIAAGVIAQPATVPYDVIVIDKGTRDGVALNAPVYAGYEQVIGFVEEVYDTSAIVVLVTTPELESTVYIIGPDIYTTAVGQGGGVLKVGVPQGILLSEGDLVIIPSLAGGVYGEIVLVDSLPTRPEQYGYVTMSEPMQNIRWVSVGTDVLEPISFETARSVVDGVKQTLTSVPVPQGVLVELPEEGASSSATSTATTTESQ